MTKSNTGVNLYVSTNISIFLSIFLRSATHINKDELKQIPTHQMICTEIKNNEYNHCPIIGVTFSV